MSFFKSLLLLGVKVLKTVHHSIWSREEETETQQSDLQRGVRGHPGDEWRLCAFITNLLSFHHQGDSFFLILITLSAPPAAAPPPPTQLHILNAFLTSSYLFLCLVILLLVLPSLPYSPSPHPSFSLYPFILLHLHQSNQPSNMYNTGIYTLYIHTERVNIYTPH